MIKAVEAEKAKLGLQRQTLQEIRQRLRAKKQKVEDQRKALQTAAKMLSKAELAFEQKLDEIESINQVKRPMKLAPRRLSWLTLFKRNLKIIKPSNQIKVTQPKAP